MKKKNKFSLILVITMLFSSIYGCSGSEKAPISDGNAEEQKKNVAYAVSDYQERIQNEKVSLSQYKNQYSGDIETVSQTDYNLLHFDNTVFEDFPDAEQISLLKAGEDLLSANRTITIIEDWLESIGKTDAVDLKSETGVTDPVIRENEPVIEVEDGVFWPLFYNRINNLTTTTGAFIDRTDCYTLITASGMTSMSDGKVSLYLNSKGIPDKARYITLDRDLGDKIASGSLEDLAQESYPLLDGVLSIGDGAANVNQYFSESLYRTRPEGVRSEVTSAAIYRLEDIYCYKYLMNRYYYNIPIMRTESGSYQFSGSYNIAGDSECAYVVDSKGVTAYSGINDGENLIPLLTDHNLIPLTNAVDILNESLASQMNISVNTVELTYLPLRFEHSKNPAEKIFFPCWRFSGTNRAKGEMIELFTDALTGDVYYYGYTPPDPETAEWNLN